MTGASHVADRPRVLVAVLGPTATGKSALGIALAERFGGEVISCDSTAVYRGLDVGTDKVPVEQRRGIPHHLIDVVDPGEAYTAAAYARDAARAAGETHARGRMPVVVGGTGFYYRALTRGLFPGPGRDDRVRARLDRLARRHGVLRLHRLLARIDPASGLRVQPRDQMRIVRALEVYFLTGRTLTAHFAETVSPLAGWTIVAVALGPAWIEITGRIARRVDDQFARGIVNEVRGVLARGVPPDARSLAGLGYRQVIEHLRGERDEAATRDLIEQETRRYARRQLIWFRKEPNLVWIHALGEHRDAYRRRRADRGVAARICRGRRTRGRGTNACRRALRREARRSPTSRTHFSISPGASASRCAST